jgi:hypothetical protein
VKSKIHVRDVAKSLLAELSFSSENVDSGWAPPKAGQLQWPRSREVSTGRQGEDVGSTSECAPIPS